MMCSFPIFLFCQTLTTNYNETDENTTEHTRALTNVLLKNIVSFDIFLLIATITIPSPLD